MAGPFTAHISSTPLTFTHLRFQARACTPIRLGQYQGAEAKDKNRRFNQTISKGILPHYL